MLPFFQSLPCLPRYIYEAPVFILAEDYTYHMIVSVTYLAVLCLEVLTFVALLVMITLKQLKTHAISQKTYRMQRNLFRALVIQVAIPFVTLLLPLIYAFIAIELKYYNQAMTNIAIIIGSMHGFVSTIVMLFVHHPYREAFLDIFIRKNGQQDEAEIRRSRYLKNNSIAILKY